MTENDCHPQRECENRRPIQIIMKMSWQSGGNAVQGAPRVEVATSSSSHNFQYKSCV